MRVLRLNHTTTQLATCVSSMDLVEEIVLMGYVDLYSIKLLFRIRFGKLWMQFYY